MYYTTSEYTDQQPTVTYDEFFNKYTILINERARLIVTQEEMEYLYHEMLGAMLHRRYGSTDVDDVVENNALDAILRK
jgi:Fe-S cluster biosynthesis and repair protein YggX